MRLSHILHEYRRNWVINSLGFILLIVGFAVLSINEGRSFNHSKGLEEALAEVVSFKNDNFNDPIGKSENYEGKLIHVSGELRVQEPIADSTYNILVQAVKLRKIVQMYQWHEDYTENKFTEDEADRSYFYFKDWSEQVIDSRSFHSLGHQNPRQIPIQSKLMIADKVFINNFLIGDAAKALFTGWTDVTSDTRPDDTFIKMHIGWYYHVEDLFEPIVGDVRVKFQFCGLEGSTFTIVGKLVNGHIQPYDSRSRKKIILLSKGELTMEEIFHEEHFSNRKKTWIVRLFGWIMIFFGVISVENLLKLFANTRLSFISPDQQHQFRSKLKITTIFTVAVCVLRQSLHYVGIYN